jgi:hypothetical protein
MMLLVDGGRMKNETISVTATFYAHKRFFFSSKSESMDGLID